MARIAVHDEAEAFQALLDGTPSGEAPGELLRMAAIARSLDAPRAEMRPEFRAALRRQVLAEAARTRPVPIRMRDWVAERNDAWRRSRRMVSALAAAVMVMLAGGSVFAASTDALPNSSLYAFKRAREEARLLAVRGDEARGLRLTVMARTRVLEIDALADAGERDDQPYVKTFRTLDEQTREARSLLVAVFERTNRADPVRRLDDLASLQVEVLAPLLERLPAGALPYARSAVEYANDLKRETGDLLRGCPCEQPAPETPPAIDPADGQEPPVTCVCEPAGDDRTPTSGGGTTPGTDGDDRDGSDDDGSDDDGDGGDDGSGNDPNTVPDVPGTDVDDDVEDVIEDILSPLPTVPSTLPSLPAAPSL